MSSPRRHLAERGEVLQDAFKRFSMEKTASAPSSLAHQLQAALASAAGGEGVDPPKATRSAQPPARRMKSLGGTPWQTSRSMLHRAERAAPQAQSPHASPPAVARVLSARTSMGEQEAATLSKHRGVRGPVRRMVTTPAAPTPSQNVNRASGGVATSGGVSTYSPVASPNVNSHRAPAQPLPYDEAEAAIAKAAQMLDKVNLPRRSHASMSPAGGNRTTRSVSPRPEESCGSSKRQRPTKGDPPIVPPKVTQSPATLTRTQFVSPRNSMRNALTTVPVVPPLALNKASQQVFTSPGSPKAVSPRVLMVSSVSPRHSLAGKPVIASMANKGSVTVPVAPASADWPDRRRPSKTSATVPLNAPGLPHGVTTPSPPAVTSPTPQMARQISPPTVTSSSPSSARSTLQTQPPAVTSPAPPPARQSLPPGCMTPAPPPQAQPSWNSARYTIPAKPQQRLACMNRGVRHQSGARTPSPTRMRLQISSSVTNIMQQAPSFAISVGCRSSRGA